MFFRRPFKSQRLRTPIQVENFPAQSTLCDLNTHQGTNMSHLFQRKIIFKTVLGRIALWSTESKISVEPRGPQQLEKPRRWSSYPSVAKHGSWAPQFQRWFPRKKKSPIGWDMDSSRGGSKCNSSPTPKPSWENLAVNSLYIDGVLGTTIILQFCALCSNKRLPNPQTTTSG